MRMRKILALIGASVLLPAVLLAQEVKTENQSEKSSKASDDYSAYQMDGIVVTSSKLPKTKGNVTQKVDIIDEKQLEERVYENRNVAEALAYEPGVFVNVLSRNDANWGSFGGLGPKYNTFLLDGLPIDSFIDTMNLSTWALNRVEIQRGPASVLYPNYLSMDFAGNESPLAGTTNLILKEKVDKMQTKIWSDFGSYNTFTEQVYHQNKIGNLHYYVGGSYDNSDYTNYGTDPSWLNMTKDPEYEKAKMYFRGTYYIDGSDAHKVSTFVNYVVHDGDAGRPNREFDHNYTIVNANYYNEFNSVLTGQLKAGYRNYDRSWQEDNFPDLRLREWDGVKQEIVPIDMTLSLKHFEKSLLTVGSDFQHAKYETWSNPGIKSIGNDAQANQAGIYIQEELGLGDWILRAGGRYTYTEHFYDLIGGIVPGVDGKSWEQPTWNAGVRYNFTKEASVYGNVGSSYLVPAIKSIAGTLNPGDQGVPGKNGQLPNPGLTPETGLGSDLGIDYLVFKDLKLGVRGFYNKIDDAIVTNRVSLDPSQSQDINAGKATSYGIEAEMKYRIIKNLYGFVNYTYTNSNIENPIDPDQNDVEMPFVPEHMGNIGLMLDIPGNLTAAVYLRVAGSIFDSNSRTGRIGFDPYEVLNASFKKIIWKNECYEANLHLNLYNITNRQYEMPWQFQDPGFAAAGGVGVTF
ncbi:MAG: TonB-dependent receptor [Syntrophobacteraceae bacterium]